MLRAFIVRGAPHDGIRLDTGGSEYARAATVQREGPCSLLAAIPRSNFVETPEPSIDGPEHLLNRFRQRPRPSSRVFGLQHFRMPRGAVVLILSDTKPNNPRGLRVDESTERIGSVFVNHRRNRRHLLGWYAATPVADRHENDGSRERPYSSLAM